MVLQWTQPARLQKVTEYIGFPVGWMDGQAMTATITTLFQNGNPCYTFQCAKPNSLICDRERICGVDNGELFVLHWKTRERIILPGFPHSTRLVPVLPNVIFIDDNESFLFLEEEYYKMESLYWNKKKTTNQIFVLKYKKKTTIKSLVLGVIKKNFFFCKKGLQKKISFSLKMKDLYFKHINQYLHIVIQSPLETPKNVCFLREMQFVKHTEKEWIRPVATSLLTTKNLLISIGSFFDTPIFMHPLFLSLVWKNVERPPTLLPPILQSHLQLKLPPKPHQWDALEQFRLRSGEMILGAQIGVGKSIEILMFILYLQTFLPHLNVLLVVPSTLIPNWFAECEKFTFLQLHPVKKAKTPIVIVPDQSNLYIVSYNLLHHPTLHTTHWDFICADECHFLKNTKSKRHQLFKKLIQKTKYKLLASGTPSQRACEYFSLLSLLDPIIFKDFYTPIPPRYNHVPKLHHDKFYFVDRWCQIELKRIYGGKFIYDFKKSKRMEELHSLLSYYMIVQLQKDVLTLPPLIKEPVSLGSVGNKDKMTFQLEITRIKNITNEMEKRKEMNALIMQTSHLKNKFVIDYIKTFMDIHPNEKILIFFHHRDFGHELQQAFPQEQSIYIDGEIKVEKRYELLTHFKQVDACRLGFLSLATCSTGLTLTFLHLVLVAELIYDSILLVQAEGRCHRITQEHPVLMQYLLLEHCTDRMMYGFLQHKLQVSDQILHGDDPNIK